MTQLKISKKLAEQIAKKTIQGRKDSLEKMNPKPEKKEKDVRK